MNRPVLLVLAGTALLAAGAYYASRTARNAPADTPRSVSEGPQLPKTPPAGPPDAPAPVQPAESPAASASAPPASGRTDAPLTRRPVTLYERDTVRELIKLHADSGQGEKGERDANLPEPAWPVDDDSLFLKYGSLDKARTQEALTSTQAILDWQSDGPFEDKSLELMPPALLRAFELEREWLIQRLQDM